MGRNGNETHGTHKFYPLSQHSQMYVMLTFRNPPKNVFIISDHIFMKIQENFQLKRMKRCKSNCDKRSVR